MCCSRKLNPQGIDGRPLYSPPGVISSEGCARRTERVCALSYLTRPVRNAGRISGYCGRVGLMRSRMLVLLFCFLGLMLPKLTHSADTLDVTSSLNPVGSGARALGMGGAFIAIADDATAASWNPGGLIQLERPEVSIVGAGVHRIEGNTFGTNPEANGAQSISEERLNYLSIAYPFRFLGHSMVVSANYQHLYDFSREWDVVFNLDSLPDTRRANIDYEQKGQLGAVGLAYCVQVTPGLSFGVTLNFWEDWLYDNEWERTNREHSVGTLSGFDFTLDGESYDRYSFSGFNANLGLLWQVSEKLTCGAVLKTPFEADLRHESYSSSVMRMPAANLELENSVPHVEEDETLDMPISYGLGFAYRFSDRFTASFDVTRTEWDDLILTDSNGNETSFITGKPKEESDIDPIYQVRLGAEYLFIKKKCLIPLRGGIFYDPAPAEGSPDDFFGFSLGSGVAVGALAFDIAYQYRFGNNVGEALVQGYDFSQDVEEHTLYTSLILYF